MTRKDTTARDKIMHIPLFPRGAKSAGMTAAGPSGTMTMMAIAAAGNEITSRRGRQIRMRGRWGW
jgi:hypothetical protein